ncbi:hypothetical protein BOW51_03865 [Solemya velesiana gill symbiont]|uniref:Uncharacterized protein n=1 Tax=Solemya velesiana gill symbiont TaxID=1918948 RepID=A0A1T2KWB1_9GAMM|nr:hypothetical protein BOW51_03865 [Solemya velesiana gill symbiont]
MFSALCAANDEDAWFTDNSEERSLAASEGELRFLPSPPASPAHHHINHITITPRSLVDGWVTLNQCHEHIDPVPKAEITFRSERIRNIELIETENIGRAWTEGATIRLEEIDKDARLCLKAETRALHPMPQGGYELRNGPYMRRFLDGYYPMLISLEIHYPEKLKLIDASPQPQPGFQVIKKGDEIALQSWFEGKLYTRIRFRPVSTGNP